MRNPLLILLIAWLWVALAAPVAVAQQQLAHLQTSGHHSSHAGQQPSPSSTEVASTTGSDSASVCVSEHDNDSDKISVVSESDSGVICSSRPNSFIGLAGGLGPMPSLMRTILTPPPANGGAYCLICAACHKPTYFADENGPHYFPQNKALANVVLRFLAKTSGSSGSLTCGSPLLTPTSPAASPGAPLCQLCESMPPAAAAVFCDQCDIFYCPSCQQSCHPSRGPLAKHSLLPAYLAAKSHHRKLSLVSGQKEPKCAEHLTETLTMFCMVCKLPVCCLCLQDGRHGSHDVQSLASMCKAQKVSDSHSLN